MDGGMLARMVAVIFVAVAVTAAALELTGKKGRPADAAPLSSTSAPNPLREGLRRCQILGEAALRDQECSRLWAEQRDRFLGFETPFTTFAEPGASPDGIRQGAR
ncbi:putative entry exclusion protein TrbK-alt [Mesorhizobium sp. B1-1-8]|uniref:putative entry exclusion protein TrbK-alt n=1 Tax=Mesorhizobium sp. B1-1-8 TaxID=2589976 RepID=UPI00112B4B55|nr:putative entry exclusion protein TrbK-alt [Mesorhizobium sp. B1-1-8]UCI05155.1 putative entry exclusion protein TrbK-alt [Mesorhizobium sp. B1-1-8]